MVSEDIGLLVGQLGTVDMTDGDDPPVLPDKQPSRFRVLGVGDTDNPTSIETTTDFWEPCSMDDPNGINALLFPVSDRL